MALSLRPVRPGRGADRFVRHQAKPTGVTLDVLIPYANRDIVVDASDFLINGLVECSDCTREDNSEAEDEDREVSHAPCCERAARREGRPIVLRIRDHFEHTPEFVRYCGDVPEVRIEMEKGLERLAQRWAKRL